MFSPPSLQCCNLHSECTSWPSQKHSTLQRPQHATSDENIATPQHRAPHALPWENFFSIQYYNFVQVNQTVCWVVPRFFNLTHFVCSSLSCFLCCVFSAIRPKKNIKKKVSTEPAYSSFDFWVFFMISFWESPKKQEVLDDVRDTRKKIIENKKLKRFLWWLEEKNIYKFLEQQIIKKHQQEYELGIYYTWMKSSQMWWRRRCWCEWRWKRGNRCSRE